MSNKLKNFLNKLKTKNENIHNDLKEYDMYDENESELPKENSKDNLTIEKDILSKRTEIFVPKIFNDVKNVADELKSNKIALVDLSQLKSDDKRRVIDFISGVIYINDGSQKKLEKEIYKLIIRK
ncbi:cell division protein SepF [Entomoplasma ellychniae]|uniref:Cell division protein SepF n=1 Tax=Entomoplasma ellychniae TaxID=2114 RepID=A0A8E2QZ19_9MOLU|nr:cell division protein SepF [Entomoplasma ellychniae]PPE04495.1 cell division protein SepF [Entomoplasma ellychniae]